MAIRYIIIDDSEAFARHLSEQLELYNAFDFRGRLTQPQEVEHSLDQDHIDVVFCRKNLPFFPSENFCLVCKDHRKDLIIVLYSDREEDAYDALESRCFDFFALPLRPVTLGRVVSRIEEFYALLDMRNKSKDRSIMIRTRQGFQMARLHEILFVERVDRRSRILLTDGSSIELSGYTIGQLERMLADSGFYRCYKSFIVNIAHVDFVRSDNDTKTYTLRLKNYKGEIPLSREKYMEVVEILKSDFTKFSI